MFKLFVRTLFLCFGALYLLALLSKSLGAPDVRFEEYYVNRYTIGPVMIQSTGVHGSGSDLDGYYANAFYGQSKPLPIRFTDLDPQSQIELDVFFAGILILLSSCVPLGIWMYRRRAHVNDLRLFVVLFSVGVSLTLLCFVPIISFGRHYVNDFVAG